MFPSAVRDNAKQFINHVQTAGMKGSFLCMRTGGSSQELDQSGQTSTYQVYDEYDEQYMMLRLTLTSPTDMRVIYGPDTGTVRYSSLERR